MGGLTDVIHAKTRQDQPGFSSFLQSFNHHCFSIALKFAIAVL
jgi:hypothetical protein